MSPGLGSYFPARTSALERKQISLTPATKSTHYRLTIALSYHPMQTVNCFPQSFDKIFYYRLKFWNFMSYQVNSQRKYHIDVEFSKFREGYNQHLLAEP